MMKERTMGFSRFKLQELLTQVAIERGVKIVYNAQVVSVDLESPKPSVTLQDGRVMSADLIIGADGTPVSLPFQSSSI
jgi:2-polyprenyl-6-methoxyphenol hydroxylase-like FAD-dependent oxidoreductase